MSQVSKYAILAFGFFVSVNVVGFFILRLLMTPREITYVSDGPTLTSEADAQLIISAQDRASRYFTYLGLDRGDFVVMRLATRWIVRSEGLILNFRLSPHKLGILLRDKQRLGKDSVGLVEQLTRRSNVERDPRGVGDTVLSSALDAMPYRRLPWWPPSAEEMTRLTPYRAKLLWDVSYRRAGDPYYVLINRETGSGYLIGY